ncbi:hypothetical protein DAI22_02g086200 [Oryza sativa Japonica Group]|nr:hypothetical protein DAI22_02g086200 [Oryza sativa Japonica Group]
MLPLKLLPCRKRLVSLTRLPTNSGICPKRLFCAKLRIERLLKFPTVDGICPKKLFLANIRSRMLLRFPTAGGIYPKNELSEISSFSKCFQCHKLDGILPLKLFPSI